MGDHPKKYVTVSLTSQTPQNFLKTHPQLYEKSSSQNDKQT